MNNGFRTVFEVSYFSNGALLMSLVFLGVGVWVASGVVRGRFVSKPVAGAARVFLIVWAVVWNTFSLSWVAGNLITAHRLTNLLAAGQCEIVEGTVAVLHEQPRGGHAAGDRIRIGGREFSYSNFTATVAFRQTISHGGPLRNGTQARIWFSGDQILKVAVKAP